MAAIDNTNTSLTSKLESWGPSFKMTLERGAEGLVQDLAPRGQEEYGSVGATAAHVTFAFVKPYSSP